MSEEPPRDQTWIDEVADRFERVWKQGPRPRIEHYLAGVVEPRRSRLLQELLRVERELRTAAGECPSAAEYRRRFPGHGTVVDSAFVAASTASPEPARRPEADRPQTQADHGLLLGLLALQNNFIDRETLVAAFTVWVAEKARPLGEILIERGVLDEDTRALLEALARKHLDLHGGDPERSLAALGAPGLVRQDLEKIADSELHATLSRVAAPPRARDDPDATPTYIETPANSRGGRFRILRFHDRGGLGDVFVAHDSELNREVALKQIQDRHAADPRNWARFVVEAEITGGLEHPGIVPIYGLGHYDDGRPFYAMRFIKGNSLKSEIKKFHGGDAAGRDPSAWSLELRHLLSRFLHVCNAIAYAHSRGVLHRDLKPSNILLGPFGETLVVDWGLAKVIGRKDDAGDCGERTLRPPSASGSALTLAGTNLGTPAYMSPEQAEGRLDLLGPASDVYSLGATLYCLLTGRPPFEDQDVVSILTNVRNGNFPPVRQINPKIAPTLEAICLKAMALRPDDRYSSPRQLASDIEHWMADEPVQAYREPRAARLARWARRHKPIVAGAAGLLMAAVVTLSISAVLINGERARKEEQRQLALVNFTLAQGAHDMLTEAGAVDLAEVPQMEPVRRLLLERARSGYQKFLDQRGDDPLVRSGAVRAHNRLGDVHEMMGEYPDAERSYRRAVALLKEKGPPGGPSAAVETRSELARAHHGLGMLLTKTNRFRESEATLREAIQLREALAAASPGDTQGQQALADSRYHLAALRARLSGQQAENEAVYRDVVTRQQALVTQNRDRPESRVLLGRYLNNLGKLLSATGHAAEAEACFREVLTTQSVLNRENPGLPGPRWQLARSANNLAALISGVEGRAQEVAELLRYARSLLDTLQAEFPKIPQYKLELAAVEGNLGRMEGARGQSVEAEMSFRRAKTLLEGLATGFPLVPEYQQKLALNLFDLNLFLAKTDPAAAEPVLREALKTQEGLISAYPNVPEYSHVLGRSLYNLAYVLMQKRNHAEARRFLDRAIVHHKTALVGNPANRDFRVCLYEDHGVLALAWLEDGDAAQAAAIAEELPGLLPDDYRSYANCAAILTRCAASVAESITVEEPRRRELESHYKQRAAHWLKEAARRGLIQPPPSQVLPAFEFPRGGEDVGRFGQHSILNHLLDERTVVINRGFPSDGNLAGE